MIKSGKRKVYGAALALCCLFYGSLGAQVIQNRFDEKAVMESFDAEGKPFSRTNSARSKPQGSPMLNPDWGSGIVYFRSGKQTKPMEVQFNLQRNQLTFREGNKVMSFSDPVSAFRIIYVFQDSLHSQMFRSGYPADHGRQDDFFYQVWVDGERYQLLSDRSMQAIDAYTYLGGEKMEYRHTEVFYLFDVRKNAFIEIRLGKKKWLPGAAELQNEVAAIAAREKLSVDKPGDWPALVTALNAVTK